MMSGFVDCVPHISKVVTPHCGVISYCVGLSGESRIEQELVGVSGLVTTACE
jgi:hypothetical protein